MRVFVESNFPLELARQQEEVVHAEEILRLAETGRIELIFPAIAITEPFSSLLRYENERKTIQDDLNRLEKDLDRSTPNQPLAASMRTITQSLIAVSKTETDLLEKTAHRMLGVGRSIPLTPAVFADAQAAEIQFDLSPQDAIVYASIVSDLDVITAPRPLSCFLSKNSKDFNVTRGELKNRNCNYIHKFAGGLAFILANI